MATFAKNTFNSAVYAAFRPKYPQKLYQHIFQRHEAFAQRTGTKPRWDLAVDLGCGTGQATAELTRFERVVGVDPGAGMLEGARKYVAEHPEAAKSTAKFDFVQGGAESVPSIEAGSADLVIAAQAAHWFNWDKVWPEVSRILAPKGTAAFWIYSEFRLSDYPQFTADIYEYAQGSDPKTTLGPHWQRPGRTILERHLVDVPEPSQELGLGKLERTYFAGDHYPDSLPADATLPVIMRQQTTWNGLLGYLKTFSSLHTFKERYSDEGALEERFWLSLLKKAYGPGSDAQAAQNGEKELTIEWPIALIVAHKTA